MKGVIPACLKELVINKFGIEKWGNIIEAAGLPRSSFFLPTKDVADADVLKMVNSTCKVLNLSLQQAADAFGDYWVNEYAPKIYYVYYKKSNSAKEFIMNMNNVHKTVTKNIPNSKPPGFEYNWKDDKTLIMTYKSSRGLIDFMIGLIKGVGRYYKEELKVTKLGNDKVQIIFSK